MKINIPAWLHNKLSGISGKGKLLLTTILIVVLGISGGLLVNNSLSKRSNPSNVPIPHTKEASEATAPGEIAGISTGSASPTSSTAPKKNQLGLKPTSTPTPSTSNTNAVTASPQPTQAPVQQYVSNTPSPKPINIIIVQPTASPTPTTTPTSTPTPVLFQPDPAIIAKLDELRQTLANIQNATVPMSVIEGRKQAAYQKWMQDNFDAYAVISGNSYYLNLLNSIKGAYGI